MLLIRLARIDGDRTGLQLLDIAHQVSLLLFRINWQALRPFLKRVPVYTHPARVRPPVREATKRTCA